MHQTFNRLYSADYEMLPYYPTIPIWIVIYPHNVPPQTEIVINYGRDIATQQNNNNWMTYHYLRQYNLLNVVQYYQIVVDLNAGFEIPQSPTVNLPANQDRGLFHH
jgi:hypothetical protein